MFNLIIIGCGRSGTSAITGVMHNSDYYTGDNFIPIRNGCPKGFFEDSQVIKLNDKILFNSYPKKFPFSGEWALDYKYSIGNEWLARVGLDVRLFCSKEIEERIKKILENEPFCYKDPRFCYTLPVWKPFLKNTRFICIFREPAITAMSLIKESRDDPFMKNIPINFLFAIELWTLMYKHVLEKHFPYDNWIFIHYNQLFTKEGLNKIEEFLGIKINRDFIDKNLRRIKSSRFIPEETLEIYKKLCSLAGYKNGN